MNDWPDTTQSIAISSWNKCFMLHTWESILATMCLSSNRASPQRWCRTYSSFKQFLRSSNSDIPKRILRSNNFSSVIGPHKTTGCLSSFLQETLVPKDHFLMPSRTSGFEQNSWKGVVNSSLNWLILGLVGSRSELCLFEAVSIMLFWWSWTGGQISSNNSSPIARAFRLDNISTRCSPYSSEVLLLWAGEVVVGPRRILKKNVR